MFCAILMIAHNIPFENHHQYMSIWNEGNVCLGLKKGVQNNWGKGASGVSSH